MDSRQGAGVGLGIREPIGDSNVVLGSDQPNQDAGGIHIWICGTRGITS